MGSVIDGAIFTETRAAQGWALTGVYPALGGWKKTLPVYRGDIAQAKGAMNAFAKNEAYRRWVSGRNPWAA